MPVADEQRPAIKLVDATAPAQDAPPPSPPESEAAPPSDKDLEHAPSDNWLTRKGRARGGTIRKEWTKHKYARFQDGRGDDGESTSDEDEGADGGNTTADRSGDGGDNKGKGKSKYSTTEESNNDRSADVSRPQKAQTRSGRLRDRLPLRHRPRRNDDRRAREHYVVDVLYENQRGAFFCGIPLYSGKSLLNFDPAAWQTVDLADSPVNITNAQVPDPTWVWAWPCWYVDMSHDVDDQGWEYSLSFRQGFSWHGSQPWFTSFVRRRRWLRKRVRVRHPAVAGRQHTMHEAHVLNSDYFTIHTGRPGAGYAGSRDSSAERNTYRASTFGPPEAYRGGDESDVELDGDEITSVAQLLRRLRQTTIDRKKLDAFRSFLRNGGDELSILPEQMEDIISLFLYQNSRRQVLLELENALSLAATNENTVSTSAGKQREDSQEEGSNRRRNPGLSIKSALDVIATQVKELEYYSDIKAVSSPLSADHPEFDNVSIISANHEEFATHRSSIVGEEAFSSPTRESGDYGSRIKGIPAAAHVGENVGLAARVSRARKQQEERERKSREQKREDENTLRQASAEEVD